MDAGQTITEISRDIGYSRTALSLYLSGGYSAVTAIEAAILKVANRHLCPHTSEMIDPLVCARKAGSPKPFGGSARRAWWVCCQQCDHKPKPEEEA
jgi:hypothetical protein